MLDLSLNNPKLAKLAVVRAPAGTKSSAILLSQMPKSMQADLMAFYTTLFGSTTEDFKVLLVTFNEDGSFKRAYAPCVYKNESDQVFIAWGDKRALFDEPLALESIDVDTIKFGKYEDLALILELATGSSMPFQLRLLERPDDTRIIRKAFTKGGVPALAQFLSPPMTKRRESLPMIDVRQLKEGHPYTLLEARKVRASYGPTYVLTIKADPEVGLETDHDAWSHKNLNLLLDAGAILPGTLIHTSTEWAEGKFRHNFALDCEWPDGDDELNLSW